MFAIDPANRPASSLAGHVPENPGLVEESVLWDNFKKGNDLAFTILYRKYVQRLFNYGMHTCRDKELVLDCLQELFARLWDKRETVSAVGSVNFYLFKSFRRLLMSKIIARKRFSTVLAGQSSMFDFMPSAEDGMIDAEARKIQSEHLQRCIKALTRRQREALFLRFFNDLSYHEVAAIMEIRVDSVYNIISKAIDILRRKMRVPLPFAILLATAIQ
ncbi:MAG: sigma-70 family RNA polymerase sigma factor [Cyclobacteriaceae bacterium]|nr:sigma-70 family RNA polymerase sigma factor [Cyclobacteriaceae bacterium]